MESMIRRLRDAQAMAKLIGEAPAFLKAIGPLPAVAQSGAIVLISGETGTGKELVARAIHYLSEQAAFPFVPVNLRQQPIIDFPVKGQRAVGGVMPSSGPALQGMAKVEKQIPSF